MKTCRAVNPALRCIGSADPERTYAPGDAHISPLRCLPRQTGGRSIQFSHAVLESVPLQSHRIRAESVRLDYPRTCPHILFMDAANPIRSQHAKLFQTPIHRHPAIQQQRPHGAIAAKHARLEFS